MEDTKKAILSIVSVAGAIYALYTFYKQHADEIKAIIEPAIDACKDLKEIALYPDNIW